jgi:hypothetical protein
MTGSLTRRDPAKDPLAFERVPHIVMDPPRHRSIAMPPYRALLLRTTDVSQGVGGNFSEVGLVAGGARRAADRLLWARFGRRRA